MIRSRKNFNIKNAGRFHKIREKKRLKVFKINKVQQMQPKNINKVEAI